jgi:site-specific DNA recombinase
MTREPLRLDGYIRVSDVRGRSGETFISPSVQREKIEGYAALHGHEIAAIHEELDQSGGKLDRPLFQHALGRVERGETDGIVVAKLDRFARSLVGALESLRRIEEAGGQLVSVEDSFDTTTPMGRFALQITLALAELERSRIRENWIVAQQRAVDRGVHITPRVPVGYKREDDRRLLIDPNAAEAITEAFAMRAAGVRLGVIADMLNDRGVRTSYGGRWIGQTVDRMLRNRVYLGEARGQGGVAPLAGAHEALVTEAVFAGAPQPRAIGPRRAESLLAGILRCAGCRYSMTKSGQRGIAHQGRYRCRVEHTAGRCPAPTAVHPHVIEGWVIEQFLDVLADDSPMIEVAALNVTVEPLRRSVEHAEAELAAWRDDTGLVDLGRDVYIDGLQARMQRRDMAHENLQEALADIDSAAAFEHAIALRDEFPHLPTQEQRLLLTSTIDVVFLRRGRIHISNRALILWRGQGPTDLPRRAKPSPIRSFGFPTNTHVAARMPPPADLPVGRSERPARLKR